MLCCGSKRLIWSLPSSQPPEGLAQGSWAPTLNCLTILSVQTTPELQMRYNCQALYTLDEVAAQCKEAILKADAKRALDVAYAEILENARWENDILIAA